MTLREIAAGYRDAARRVSARADALKDAARTSPYAARDRAVLLEVKRDLVRLGYHCEHYYERGYWRNEKYTQ